MKILFIFILFFFHLSANELAWVNEQVEAIKPPRDGLQSNSVSMLKDPFIFLEKNKLKKDDKKDVKAASLPFAPLNISNTIPVKPKKQSKIYVLSAVMNHSALINGNWYNIGDKIGSYTLSKVERLSVVLSKKNHTIQLSTISNTKNLKFKNR